MDPQNFTPITDLLDDLNAASAVSYSKETGPAISSQEVDSGEKQEYSQLQEAKEHEPDEEVKKIIKIKRETIELPPDLKKMGLQPASSTSFSSFQNVKLPLSDDKVFVGLQQPVSSSFRWLAELCIYLLRHAHLTLKTIHGKVVRVIQK